MNFSDRNKKWKSFIIGGLFSVLLLQPMTAISIPIPPLLNIELKGVSPKVVSQIDGIRTQILNFPDSGDALKLSEIYGNIGMLFQSVQQVEAAVNSYELAVLNDPKNPQWLYLLGVLYEQAGELDNAKVALRRSFELESGYLPTLIHLGDIASKQDDVEQAKRIFIQLIKQDKYQAISAESLGQLSLKSGDVNESIDYFNQVLSLQPQANRVYYFLAQAYKKLGDKERAKQALSQRGEIAPNYPDPMSAYVASLNISTKKLLSQGLEMAKKGEYKKALEIYAEGLEIEPNDVELLTASGLINEYIGDNKQARVFYEKALEIKKDDGNALFNIAVLNEIDGYKMEAKKNYYQLLSFQKDHKDAITMLADLEFREGNYIESSKLLARLQDLAPNVSQIKIYRAVSLLASGNCPWGRNILNEGLKVDPSNGNIALLLAATLAQCSDDDGLKRARVLVNQVYDSAPSFLSARFAAYILAYVGNFTDAIVLQEQAMFEALKNGGIEQYPDLAVNMKRYREGKKPDWNWQAYAIEIAKPVPSRKGK